MRRSLLAVMLLLIVSHASPILGAAQAARPTKAACEMAIRVGLQALTQQPQAEVEALIADWGTAEIAVTLGLPEGCRLPPSVPAIEPLEDGGFAVCLWWDPRTGDLGSLLDEAEGWNVGWWECIAPGDLIDQRGSVSVQDGQHGGDRVSGSVRAWLNREGRRDTAHEPAQQV